MTVAGKWLLLSFLLLAIPVQTAVAQNDATTTPSDSTSRPAQQQAGAGNAKAKELPVRVAADN